MADQEFTTQELADEIWKPVVGYEGTYEVSDLGRVRRISTRYGRPIAPRPLKRQPGRWSKRAKVYYHVNLSLNGAISRPMVHGLVLEAFVGPMPPDKEERNHINGIGTDNRAGNLEYVTHLENVRHAFASGLCDHQGEKNGGAVLTEDQVVEIRTRYAARKDSDWGLQAALAREYGIKDAAMNFILHGKSWKHAGGPTLDGLLPRQGVHRRLQFVKLTEDQVRAIRSEYESAPNKQGLKAALARRYGVTPPSIRGIVLRRNWKDI